MKFKVDGLPVYFPCDYIYPEQYSYMLELKRAFDEKGHCLFEMPSGAGKTTALLSVSVAYMKEHPNQLTKLVYCCRTVPERAKGVEELKKLMDEKECGPEQKRQLMGKVVFCSYQDLLDPKIARGPEIEINSVVVFDEAHNIDQVCTESMSITINGLLLDKCNNIIQVLDKTVTEMEEGPGEHKQQNEYERLVNGLRDLLEPSETSALVNPVLPGDILQDAVPENIRVGHSIAFMKQVVEYLDSRLRIQHVVQESLAEFLRDLLHKLCMDQEMLRSIAERLTSLFRTLEISDSSVLFPLATVFHLVTLVLTYSKGFIIFIEPSENCNVRKSILHLSCLDASIAMKPVFNRFQTVVMTSGTLSPLTMYPKLLDFKPAVMRSFTMTLARPSILPMIISRGSDQVALSSRFEALKDTSVVRNYGNLLLEVTACVPDGVVCFFPSYMHLELVLASWYKEGIIGQLQRNKLLCIETRDAAETSLVLVNHVKACDAGRGAVLLCVARGRISEGIDFSHHLGRAVLMFGIPYEYTESTILKSRLKYLRDEQQIEEKDFLRYNAMRHVGNCLGRCVRGKSDYAIMIHADERFSRPDLRANLPKWIQDHMTDSLCNLSTEEGIKVAKYWLRQMAQPFTRQDQLGKSLLTEDQLLSE